MSSWAVALSQGHIAPTRIRLAPCGDAAGGHNWACVLASSVDASQHSAGLTGEDPTVMQQWRGESPRSPHANASQLSFCSFLEIFPQLVSA